MKIFVELSKEGCASRRPKPYLLLGSWVPLLEDYQLILLSTIPLDIPHC